MELVALKDVSTSVGTVRAGATFFAEDALAEQLIRSGHASDSHPAPPPWTGLSWHRFDVMILASGPSLTEQQCALARQWREWPKAQDRRTIVVNTTFRRALWADVLYACDAAWWRVFNAEVERGFGGERWTQELAASREFAVKRIESERAPGLGKKPGVINQGGNGGYQAINLAFQAGARRILLLGFDMHGTHWHGRYENGLPNTAPHLFADWIKNFDRLAIDLEAEGVEVINCSPGSALTCFKTGGLQEVST